jgi:NAD(P)-dependent dehydrogenase (short-subunit alcohol dehydrogenase family)
VADPTDQAAARSVVDRIAAEAGPPEVLVNTIGMFHPGEALTATPEDLRVMIDARAWTCWPIPRSAQSLSRRRIVRSEHPGLAIRSYPLPCTNAATTCSNTTRSLKRRR